jgi:hypothetical protein
MRHVRIMQAARVYACGCVGALRGLHMLNLDCNIRRPASTASHAIDHSQLHALQARAPLMQAASAHVGGLIESDVYALGKELDHCRLHGSCCGTACIITTIFDTYWPPQRWLDASYLV